MGSVWKLLATGFGLGYLPLAPGTFGTALGAAFVLCPFSPWRETSPLFSVLFAALFAAAAIPVTARAERSFGVEDDQRIVMDEMAGIFFAMAGQPNDLRRVLLAFLLFRIFDTIKIWPAGAAEKLPEGVGIVGDDLIAGLWANGITQGLFYLTAKL